MSEKPDIGDMILFYGYDEVAQEGESEPTRCAIVESITQSPTKGVGDVLHVRVIFDEDARSNDPGWSADWVLDEVMRLFQTNDMGGWDRVELVKRKIP